MKKNQVIKMMLTFNFQQQTISCFFIVSYVLLQLAQQIVHAKPVAAASDSTDAITGPSKLTVTLGADNISAEELALWKRLLSPTLEEKYKPHKVYANLIDILDNHVGIDFIYEDMTLDDVQNLIEFKAANSESCSPEALQEKKSNLDDELYKDKPNILNYLKHHMRRQEIVCWKTFEVELLSEVKEVPKKRRQVVTKLRQSFDGLHPKKKLLDGIDMTSPDFTIALATFMSTYGRDFLEGYNWSVTPSDEVVFTDIFKKLLYKPCRDISDASSRFTEYFDQLTNETNKISTRGRKVISKKAKKWLASGRICSAVLEIDATSKPNSWDIYKAYLSFELSPQAKLIASSAMPVTTTSTTIATDSTQSTKPVRKVPRDYDDDDDEDDGSEDTDNANDDGDDDNDHDDDEHEEEEEDDEENDGDQEESGKDVDDDYYDDDDGEEDDERDEDELKSDANNQRAPFNVIDTSSPHENTSPVTQTQDADYSDEEMVDDNDSEPEVNSRSPVALNQQDQLESGDQSEAEDEDDEEGEEGDENQPQNQAAQGEDDDDEDTDLDGNKTSSMADIDDDDDDLDMMFDDDDDDDDFIGTSASTTKKSPLLMPKPSDSTKVFQTDIYKKINEAKKVAQGG